jgi:hypothetical protein
MSRACKGKRCSARRRAKNQVKRRSPKSPGASPVGAPRRNQPQPEPRAENQSTSGFLDRLRRQAADYGVIVSGILRIWDALPPDFREEMLRLLHF